MVAVGQAARREQHDQEQRRRREADDDGGQHQRLRQRIGVVQQIGGSAGTDDRLAAPTDRLPMLKMNRLTA